MTSDVVKRIHELEHDMAEGALCLASIVVGLRLGDIMPDEGDGMTVIAITALVMQDQERQTLLSQIAN